MMAGSAIIEKSMRKTTQRWVSERLSTESKARLLHFSICKVDVYALLLGSGKSALVGTGNLKVVSDLDETALAGKVAGDMNV